MPYPIPIFTDISSPLLESIIREGAYAGMGRVYNGRVYQTLNRSVYVGPGAFIDAENRCCLLLFSGYGTSKYAFIDNIDIEDQIEMIEDYMAANGHDIDSLKTKTATLPTGW